MSLIAENGVGAGDRLSFTVFVAIALHVMVILTDFIEEDPEPLPFTMEITLSQYDDEKAPEEADFLAETNQQGSGSEQQAAELTSPKTEPRPQVERSEPASTPLPTAKPREKQSEAPVVATTAENKRATLFEFTREAEDSDSPQNRRSIMERSLEIAQLEANIDEQLKVYAKRPRITRLTASSTMKAVDARYVETVVSKIETTGKTYFPREGNKKLYGKPRMSISIYADGSIRDIKVLQSSGNLTLDDKTIEIVRRAAPFAPFPKEVRKKRDVLELIRTFSYNRKGVSSF